MSKSPPIPPAQRSFHGPGRNPSLREDDKHARPDDGSAPRVRDRSSAPAQSAGATHWKSQDRG